MDINLIPVFNPNSQNPDDIPVTFISYGKQPNQYLINATNSAIRAYKDILDKVNDDFQNNKISIDDANELRFLAKLAFADSFKRILQNAKDLSAE